ncbi:MAG: carbon-nitrogen hydrolase family protein [Planctomycetota bacterium]
MPHATHRVAVVQHAPAAFDRDATLAIVADRTAEAAAKEAELVLFPEAFVPAYPRGLGFGMVVGSRTDAGRELWRLYSEQAVEVPSPASERLGAIAREHAVHLAIGVVELDAVTRGTLYCTLLVFGPDGRLLHHHRKLKPTAAERLVWGEGDGSSLHSIDTDLGRVGGLICWENYMPRARAAIYESGCEVYLAPTADHREAWQHTMRHVALEGRCFVLGCNQVMDASVYPPHVRALEPDLDEARAVSRGGSVIVAPTGEVLAGPLWDEPGMLVADLDMDLLRQTRLDFDVAGHYARADVFR